MTGKISVELRDRIEYRIHFEDIDRLNSFCKKEGQYWQKHEQLLQSSGKPIPRYASVYQHFLQASQHITEVITKNTSEEDLGTLISHLQQNHFRFLPDMWYSSSHAFCEKLIEINVTHNQETAEAFLQYVNNVNRSFSGNRDDFTGGILGYEFVHQGSDLTSRRKSEKLALSQIKSRFSKDSDALIAELESLKEEINQFKIDENDMAKRVTNAFIYKARKRFERQKREFIDQLKQQQMKKDDLDAAYANLMHLKKPAQHWQTSAKTFKRQGYLWTLLLSVFLIGGLLFMVSMFTDWSKGKELAISLSSLQGAIIFASFIAGYGFMVRVLSKLALSSFHLMRDSQEREHLTMLYLSLLSENAVDEDSRDVVMQSLFSRSDTGLISGDGTPAIPTTSELLKQK